MPTTQCVHCGSQSNVTIFPRQNRWDDPLLSWIDDPTLRAWISNQQPTIIQVVNCIDSVLRLQVAEGPAEKWRIGRCENCRRPLFLVVNEAETEIVKTFPPISLDRPDHIPTGVADDYVEGNLCLSVGAHKASAAMFRRALQSAALEKGAEKENLIKQLDALAAKGLLNASLVDVAHQIRHFGNFGAHPDSDGLGDVSKDEAKAIKELTWQVLEALYLNPARVAAMKAALAAKKVKNLKDPPSQDQ